MQILKIVFLFLIPLVGFSQNDNLLKNGGFENRTDFWKTYNSTTAIANFTQVNNEYYAGNHGLRIDVKKLGENPWDVNLVQPFKSRKGSIYEIRFFAKTKRPGKSIRVQLQNTTYNGKEFFLSNDWEQYVWVTTAEENKLELSIHFLKTGDYFLDNLSIRKVRKNDLYTNEFNNSDGNLIVNGNFENGFENWINASLGMSKAIFKLNSKRAYEGKVCMKVNVLKLGKNPWDIQSIMEVPLKKNKKYELRFHARSLGEKTIKAQFQDEDKGIYIAKEFNTSFDWKGYTWEITPESNNMKFTVHFIDQGIIELDNFSIKEVRK